MNPPRICPNCLVAPWTDAHVRDTGDAVELPEGSCPDLFAKRNRNPVTS